MRRHNTRINALALALKALITAFRLKTKSTLYIDFETFITCNIHAAINPKQSNMLSKHWRVDQKIIRLDISNAEIR